MEDLMDKKIIGLLGAAAALSTFNNANATQVESTTPVSAANYGDLLKSGTECSGNAKG
jgi:hypothetical protein